MCILFYLWYLIKMKNLIFVFISLASFSQLKLSRIIQSEYIHLQEVSLKVESYIKSNKRVYNLLDKNEYFVFNIKQESKLFTYTLYSYVNVNLAFDYKVEYKGFFNFYELDIS